MSKPIQSIDALTDVVLTAPRAGRRRIVALAGPPASGKTTLGQALVERLIAKGCQADVVPMDGFHLDNAILTEHGTLHRKGAPESFDAEGFLSLVAGLPHADRIFYPTFDRGQDRVNAAAAQVGPECDTIIVEGNYLLYDVPVWQDLTAHWDLSVFLPVDDETLTSRLIARWLDHGLPFEEAKRRAQSNDLINARAVMEKRMPADLTFSRVS